MLVLALSTALAGYGDAVDGMPDANARAMHLWSDAVRTDPLAFEDDYAAYGCSSANFSADEQTPKAPLGSNTDLMAAADYHTYDMLTNNHFSHDSFDGTDFATRVWSFYGGNGIAENISLGYASPRDAVAGWMCSSGHRSNLMNPAYVDYGGSWVSAWATQNFGTGDGSAIGAVRTAVHEPDGNDIVFYASYGDALAPDFIDVVLDGVREPMALTWGADDQGVYSVALPDPGAGCHEYYIEAGVGGSPVTFPEEGSYGWGTCAFDDADAEWLAGQLPPSEPPPPPADPVLETGGWVAGQTVDLAVVGAASGTTVHFVLGTTVGQGPCPAPLGGLCLEVAGTVRKLGDAVADANGVAIMTFTVPAGAAGATFQVQGIADPGTGWALTEIVEVPVN